ncbi:MAG: DUF2158 domain-containing protein [Alteromonadaceae bacterium]|nr:DUF2158 domain-containing protein [Alteromonadaceae bacterium]
MTELKNGDCVELKSGGISMTIDWIFSGIDTKKASCVWFDGYNQKQENFNLTSLKLIDEDDD